MPSYVLFLPTKLPALFFLFFFAVGALADMTSLPQDPLTLWSEKKPVSPDREAIENGRVFGVDNPSVTPFWPEGWSSDQPAPAVVIFPGGGYVRLAIEHEGYDIARWFNGLGVAAFVVKYRMQEYGFPAPLLDGLRAVRLVRSHAAEWGIDANRIGVVGFSAGGHLAASVTTRHDFRETGTTDPLEGVPARPDFAILGYPVITLQGEDAHAGSRQALLGEQPSEQLVSENSLENQVKAGIPPVFIVHGIGDKAVPVGNSLNFFNQVQKHNKASELHVYQTNIHGFGMREEQGTVRAWPEVLKNWLQTNGFTATPASPDDPL